MKRLPVILLLSALAGCGYAKLTTEPSPLGTKTEVGARVAALTASAWEEEPLARYSAAELEFIDTHYRF